MQAAWLTWFAICHWRRLPSPARAMVPVPMPPKGIATARSDSPEKTFDVGMVTFLAQAPKEQSKC
jgi:hypothetical protein